MRFDDYRTVIFGEANSVPSCPGTGVSAAGLTIVLYFAMRLASDLSSQLFTALCTQEEDLYSSVLWPGHGLYLTEAVAVGRLPAAAEALLGPGESRLRCSFAGLSGGLIVGAVPLV